MHHPTERITHTTAFVTPVVEHWLSVLDIGNKKTEQNKYTLVLFMVSFSMTIILCLKMKLFFTTTLNSE